MPNYVFYDNETIASDHQKTHANLIEVFTEDQQHAATRGMLKGKLIVAKDLPAELAQEAFAKPGSRDIYIRLAKTARKNSKLALSGKKSDKNNIHPMAAEYHCPTAVRHGNTIAKFSIVPSSPGLLALKSHPFSPETPNALREAILAYFHSNPAEFDVKVRLGTGIEDSPYYTVARLIIPAQQAEDLAAESLALYPPIDVPQDAPSRLGPYSVLSNFRRRKNSRLSRLNVLPVYNW